MLTDEREALVELLEAHDRSKDGHILDRAKEIRSCCRVDWAQASVVHAFQRRSVDTACCSALNSDPAVSSHFNRLPRRSARNPRAEQHPGLSPWAKACR